MADVWFADRYDGPVSHLVRTAKYRPERRLARVLGALLAGLAVDANLTRPDLVVPAPSVWRSTLRRGFDPAAIVARDVARAVGAPWASALAVRPGPRQAGLEPEARRVNLVGRVRARRPVRGRVWWVDDVVTTGATAELCAAELLQAGADAVVVVCACLGGQIASDRRSESMTRSDR